MKKKQVKPQKNSAALSIPESVCVRGYEIKRMPLGEYLRAIETLRTMPDTLMRACFPGMDAMQALGQLRQIDAQALGELIVRALGVMPREAVKLLSVLTGVDEQTLLADPAIGLDGAAEMMEACFALNGVENFTRAAARMAAKIQQMRKDAQSAGSSG